MMSELALAAKLHAAVPMLSPAAAQEHAALAIRYRTTELDPALMLGIAAIESDFDPAAVSDPHRGWPRFCGVMQTIARDEAECAAQGRLDVGYRVGGAELRQWARICRGDVMCILLGHGCGMRGVRTGRCNGYPERVLRFAARLRGPAS